MPTFDGSKIFRINRLDFLRGVIVAFGTALASSVLGLVGGCLADPGHFLQVCYASILGFDWLTAINFAIAGGVGYLFKQFITDEDGKVLGKIQT